MIRMLAKKLLKGRNLDEMLINTMPSDILRAYLSERLWMLLRGILIFGCKCFIGKGVRLKCKRRIKLGRSVTIHDYACIDASSIGGVNIGDFCTIGRNTLIRTGNITSYEGFFIMESGSSCNANCFIGATGGIKIGKNVLMGPNITILSEEHNYQDIDKSIKEQGIKALTVEINDNVWVGSNAIILGGVTIGNGAIVGAGSVVTKSVDNNTIVVGSPAKLIRLRTSVM